MKKTLFLSIAMTLAPLAGATTTPGLNDIGGQAIKNAPAAPAASMELTDTDKKIKVCWIKGTEKDTCVYKCNNGDTVKQPMQRPSPAENNSIIPLLCPQLIFPLGKDKAEEKSDRYWKQAALRASNGTAVTINYSPLDLGGTAIASPVWISVSGPGIKGSERVRAVIMNFYEATASSADTLQNSTEVDLVYNGTAFQAQGPALPMYEGRHAWVINYRQEIAVSVNGAWLKDPVNGSSNFRFKMSK